MPEKTNLACEHPVYRSFVLSAHHEYPRIVLRQCLCHHWWVTYAEEMEPRYQNDMFPRGPFSVAAAERRAWNG